MKSNSEFDSTSSHKPTSKTNIPSCPAAEVYYVDPKHVADSTPPPEIQAKVKKDKLETIRIQVFSNYQNILGNGLLNDSDAKWYDRISRAGSEIELKNINETPNAMASGNSPSDIEWV